MSKDKTDADIAFIRALAEILNENDLGEIEVSREFGEDDELTVRLARSGPAAPVYHPAPVVTAAPPPAPSGTIPVAAETASAEATGSASVKDAVPSPMVGTVYLAPEPGAETFVKTGDAVEKGQTILIIEAMKTMNQIASPKSGVVKEILVADGEPVEYGSPLMIIA